MKIGIDAFGCEHGQSGLGSYLINFINNLPSEEKKNIELFGPEMDRYTYNSNNNIYYSAVNIPDNLKSERLWHKRKLNSFCKKNKYDVVIFPGAVRSCPSRIKAKSVIIMNTIFSSITDKVDIKKLKKSLKNANLIIAASEYIKNDLLANDLDFGKITVIENGIDHKLFFPLINEDSEFVDIKPFAIKRPYFIYSSKLSGADKKHLELIKAFEIFKKRTNLPYRLVLTGSVGDSEYAEIIRKTVYESECASDIFVTGHFPQESMQKLYCGSDLCIFPAVNEGVGLPVIEAMACGVPVICSDKGALKESAGDGPLYFDSDNPEQIADMIQTVVENKDLVKSIVQKGNENAAKYNWDETIKKTLQAISNL